MADLFRVGVTLYLVDRLTGGLALARRGLESIGMQAERAQLRIRSMEMSLAQTNLRMGRTTDLEQRGLLTERATLQQQRIQLARQQAEAAERVELARRKILGGTVMAGAGAFGLFEMGKMVDNAGEFQMRMEAAHIAALGTAEEMTKFGKIVRETSNLTMFSISDVANMGRVMGTSGIRMNSINALMPQFASAAEVLFQTKGEDPLTTVKNLAMLAHQIGRYTAGGMTPVTETVEKLALQSPELLDTFVTASGYLTPLATRGLRVPWQQVFQLLATAQQVTGSGMSSLSGRNLSDFFMRLLPGVGSAKAGAALKMLGVTDFASNPDISNVMRELGAARTRLGPDRFATEAKTAFGMRGARAAILLGDETLRAQFDRTQRYLERQKSIAGQQADLMKTYTDQLARFKTNFQTAMIDLAYPTTKDLPAKIGMLADALHRLDQAEVLHPERTKLLFNFMAALAAVTTGAGLIAVLGGLSTLLGTAGIVASAGTLAIALPAVALGIVALAEAYEHRKGIFDAMKNLAHLPPLPGSAAAGAEGMGDLLKKHPGWRPPPPSSGIWMKPPVVARPGGLPDWYSPKADPRAMPGGITPAAYFPSVESGGVVVNCTVNMGAGAASAEELADRLAPILTDKMIHALRATTSGGGVYESPYFHTGSGVSGA